MSLRLKAHRRHDSSPSRSCVDGNFQRALDQSLRQSPTCPCFFPAEADLRCSPDPGVLEVHGIQVAFCMFQRSSALQYRVTSSPAACWALPRKGSDNLISHRRTEIASQCWKHSAPYCMKPLGCNHLWGCKCVIRNQIHLKCTRIVLNLMWTRCCFIWHGLPTEHLNLAQWFWVILSRKDGWKRFYYGDDKHIYKLGSLLIPSSLQKLLAIKISPA